MIVYKITCKVNNKIYIGQTSEGAEKRFKRHLKDSESKDTKFMRAIRKYGKENFYIETIDSATTQDELDEKEFYWINYYQAAKKGYNTKTSKGKCGGDTLSQHPDKEKISEKIRKSKLGDKNPMRKYGGLKGERNGMFGKKLTDEHKMKMSIKLKGLKDSDETRKKKSLALKGKEKSAEHRTNLRLAHQKEYLGKMVIMIEGETIVKTFFDKYEYYDYVKSFGMSQSFVETWLKNGNVYINRKKLEKSKIFENKKVMYYDDYLQIKDVETNEKQL